MTMMSVKRQCSEAVELLAAIQACVDRTHQPAYRGGGLIPCRAQEFEVYIERARNLLGIADDRKS